jgi:hypothetical protein
VQPLVDDDHRPLHRDRTQAADTWLVGMSKNRSSSNSATMVVTTLPMRSAWTTARSPLSAKNSM